MRFAYADPPYLGMCAKYGHEHMGGGCWDDPETHRALIDSLSEYDGWALSLHLPSLRTILPMVPADARIMAWCKRFAHLSPHASPQYAWEPVILWGGRLKPDGREMTPRDWLASMPGRNGFRGSKPPVFTQWILDCLGVEPADTFADIFHGSGAVKVAYEDWLAQGRLFA